MGGMKKDVHTWYVIFNGRWLKDSSLLGCIVIVLSVGGIVGYVM
jgi:hypothetical protein